ncbi:MAG: UDP-glucose 4-epimerase GalE [Pseudobdellovibrionaceae bacterium]
MKILVTGGAGYIGSHTVKQLVEQGHQVWVLDNLITGFQWAISPKAEFVKGDIRDTELVKSILEKMKADAVIHFAAHLDVGESVREPLKYWNNNVGGSVSLLQACSETGVKFFVFSSTAAVYGNPSEAMVSESDLPAPINPYGESKLAVEKILRDLSSSTKMKSVILRYFNVAGASIDGTLGQATKNATHLIKVACEAACNKRQRIDIFGTDYKTPDGTGIRDYIHVEDLATAHLDALEYLHKGGEGDTFNVGYGHGFSVRQVLDSVKGVSSCSFETRETARRPGDGAQLIANSEKIKKQLGWKPKHDDLDLICRSAFAWEQKLDSRKN